MKRRLALIAVALLLGGFCVTVALALPGDIIFPRKEMQELPSAVFPHWFHRIRFRCFVCHPQIFPMEVTSEGINMDEIRAGKFCGTCHNDQIAWRPSYDTCTRCHVIREDAPE